jgi:hypothetical protein
MNLIKKHKWKVFNLFLLILGIIAIFVSMYSAAEICLETGDCQNFSRRGVWLPVQNMGIALSLIFFIFLLFPVSYFKRYLTVWFWWLFILAYSIAASTAPVGGSILAFDRSQAVLILGGLGFLQAVYFIYSFHKKKKRVESEVK